MWCLYRHNDIATGIAIHTDASGMYDQASQCHVYVMVQVEV